MPCTPRITELLSMLRFSLLLALLRVPLECCAEDSPDSDTVALLQLGSNVQPGLRRLSNSELDFLVSRLDEQHRINEEQQVRIRALEERVEALLSAAAGKSLVGSDICSELTMCGARASPTPSSEMPP